MEQIGAFAGSQAAPDGQWTNGDPQAGIQPTIPKAGWMNLLTNALLGILDAAGIARGKDPGLLLRAVRAVAGNLPGRRLALREIRTPSRVFPFFRLGSPPCILDEREWPDLVPRWRMVRLEVEGQGAFSFTASADGTTVTLKLDNDPGADLALEILAGDLIAHGGRPVAWRTVSLESDAGDLAAGDYAIVGFSEALREIQIISPAMAVDPGTVQFFAHRIAGFTDRARHFGSARDGGWRTPGEVAAPGFEMYEFAGTFVENALPERPGLSVFNAGFQRSLIRVEFSGSEPAQAFNVYWSTGREPTRTDHDGSFRQVGAGPFEIQHDGLSDQTSFYYIATAEISSGETEATHPVHFFEETLHFAEFNVPGTYTLQIPAHVSLVRSHVAGAGGGGGAAAESGTGPGGAGGEAGQASTFETATATGGAGGGGGGSEDTAGNPGTDSAGGFPGGSGGAPGSPGAPGEITDVPPFRGEGAGGAGAPGAGGGGGRGDYTLRHIAVSPLADLTVVVGAGGAGGSGPGEPGQNGQPGVVVLEI